MPCAVAQAARDSGQDVHIVGIDGHADRTIERFPHSWANIGGVGSMLKALRTARCKQLVILGDVRRPRFEKIRFDLGALVNLPTVLSLTIGGDDRLLGRVVRFFERQGLRVIAPQDIAPGLLASPGAMGRRKPDDADLVDIRLGARVIAALGPMDVGQGAVVSRQHVIAVEAVEGTDAMLRRAAGMKQWGLLSRYKGRGVLVKGCKPGQDRRVDMPTVGPQTVHLAAEARLAGIAVAAGEVMIADRDETVAAANRAGLFLYGFKPVRR